MAKAKKKAKKTVNHDLSKDVVKHIRKDHKEITFAISKLQKLIDSLTDLSVLLNV